MQSKIEEILNRWEQTYKKIDMSLDRLREFLLRIDNPHQKLPKTIHVAGTNGKGSTTAFLRAILETADHSCHIYTSPHLLRFNERIVLSGNEISDQFLEDILLHIDEESQDLDLTYYEKTTAAAFLAFSQTPADYLILETGLGGRLDATNIVSKKELTVITPISYDHTEFLGNTLREIATEKAGIMAENSLCISAPQDEAAAEALRIHANKVGCQIMFASNIKTLPKLPLKGEFQKDNASLATHAAMNLGLTKEDCLKGLQFARWPARMEKIAQGRFVDLLPDSYELYLDGGHNVAAAKAISKSLSPDFIIMGMMETKDAKAFIEEFSGKVRGLCAIPIPEENKCYSPEKLAKIAHEAGINAFFAENIENALTNIVIRYSGNLKILVCGSLYLAAEFLKQNNRETRNG